MNRRDVLRIGSGALLSFTAEGAGEKLDLAAVRAAPSGSSPSDEALIISRKWTGDLCASAITNTGKSLVHLKEVTLFSIRHSLPADTRLYGESFQMLSQTSGTLGKPLDLGYSEIKHYKLPQPDGVFAMSGMLLLEPPEGGAALLAFTSCKRFNGRFYVRDGAIDIVVDTENLELAPGQTFDLEEFTFLSGPRREALLDRLAARLAHHHSPLKVATPPTGWCSWYCFGARVTAQQVLDNLEAIAKHIPALKYVQVDDGYQPAMGDWLETGAAFGGNVRGVLKQIRERGFEPAIWVAPFIAERGSHVFQQHPDWFMKGADGQPLAASEVTFQGWRRGPWFALDGTHPEVQAHLTALFRTMRNEWGCTYFKLDANFWGAMHGGRLHDPKATRIEAYRRGMQAILRGAGASFILGCNHPIWPSLGLIHGSRSSGDIKRTWETISKVARQNLNRNWQNRRLWWNDPDAIVLAGTLPLNEFQFHATAVYASGGMILSGDDLSKIPPDRLAMLAKLLPPTGSAAVFEDDSLRAGVVELKDRRMLCLFNWSDQAQAVSIRLPKRTRLRDYWSGEELGEHEGSFTRELPGRSARLLVSV